MGKPKGKQKKGKNRKHKKRVDSAKKKQKITVRTPIGNKLEISAAIVEEVSLENQTPNILSAEDVLIPLIIDMWALQRKLNRLQGNLPADVFRSLQRPVENALQRLLQSGFEVIDNTSRKFHTGDTVKVIAYEETLGITQEIVKETLKPTIKFKSRIIHAGEIIVGTPPAKDESNSNDGKEEEKDARNN